MRVFMRPCAYSSIQAMDGSLLSGDKAAVEKVLKELLDHPNGSKEVCEGLLEALKIHPQLAASVAEVLASLGKEDTFRDVAVSCAVVPAMCPLLASDSKETRLHAMRAIGNLCFDHDDNRELVLSSGGCPLLVNQLMSCSSLPTEEEFDRLKCVTCGCLLNVANGNVKLSKELVGLEAVQWLCELLGKAGESETTVDMGLKALFVLVESGSSSPSAHLCPPSLGPAFSQLLGRCVAGELDVAESLLETMERVMNASDSVKVAVVTARCVDKLLQLVDSPLLLKAIDLLVLICADDSSLKLLSEHAALMDKVEQWLTDSTSLQRQASTALLVANMARTDEMCSSLIARGIVPHLIQLTEIEEPEELSGKVHVSALSALRNLCLPASHKPVLLEKGVLHAALACLRESKWPHVHFKSLGIARLLADQQEVACREMVVSQPGTVALVCERSVPAEPAHVKIEGSRLLAALVKHSKSEEVMRMVVSEGGVKLMSSLLDSEHVLLRNEALVAFNLLAVTLGDGEHAAIVFDALTASEVVGGVGGVVSSADSSPELLANALTLVKRLAQSASSVCEELSSLSGFTERLEALTQHSNQIVSDRAKDLTQTLLETKAQTTVANSKLAD